METQRHFISGITRSPEKSVQDRIRFESGMHPIGSEVIEFNERYPKDITAHAWNSQVAKRMREYQPEIVAVDGLSPFFGIRNPDSSEDYPVGNKQWVWAGLPDKPSRINRKGEVIVVAGDVSHGRLVHGFKEGEFSEADSNLVRKYSVEAQERTSENERRDHITETIATLVLIGAANWAVMKTGDRVDSSPKKFSRRSALKIIGGGLLLGAASTKASHLLAAFAPNTTIENFFEQVMDIGKNRFSEETWLDGRTALVIAKTQTALSQGLVDRDALASVVMGDGHGFKADDFMESRAGRAKAIYDYAKLLTKYVADVARRFPQIDQKVTQNYMLDMLAAGDLLVARDPEVKYDSPKEAIDNCVEYIGTFQSPEILEAIASLRV